MSSIKVRTLSSPHCCLSVVDVKLFSCIYRCQVYLFHLTVIETFPPYLTSPKPDNESGVHLDFHNTRKPKELSKADSQNVELLGCEISVENSKHPALNTMPELISAVYCSAPRDTCRLLPLVQNLWPEGRCNAMLVPHSFY